MLDRKHPVESSSTQTDPLQDSPISPDQGSSRPPLQSAWGGISRATLAGPILRIGTHTLLLALILLVTWGLRSLYLVANPGGFGQAVIATHLPSPSPEQMVTQMSPLSQESSNIQGISRLAHLHTDLPSRPRSEVFTYTVQAGDTLFGIAEKFGLQPETILWSNQPILADNPHNLRPGQDLNILPVNGVYYRWSAGDGLNGVSNFFQVAPQDIIDFPANQLDPQGIGDWASPNIEPGKWLVIPNGQRAFVSWSAPAIPLDDPGVASVLGSGACENVQDGVVGTGAFIWPTNNQNIIGYDYEPEANHPAIDIDGDEGDPIYAADNGVIVYAGWNDWGYGNVIVINHANGWQTLYAHLSTYYVSCGQLIFQGNPIGAIGTTGNSTGPHLHFEMMYNAVRVNPHDYLP
jgi:murein DD-endopeptidase MepM/ murein hydrolase activator NlpD